MIAKNVAEVLENHVTLEVEGIDRIYLNAYQPRLQMETGVVGFFRYHRGCPIVSPALMGRMSRSFVKDIHSFAKDEEIDIVHFSKGAIKDEVMQKRLALFDKREGLLFIGVAQEKFSTFRSRNRKNPNTGAYFPWLYRSTVMCNQYYFYILDEDFGPLFIKLSSYFPFTGRICINGHEYAKCQVHKEGISYEALDNGFFSCGNPERLQEILDDLNGMKIFKVFQKWLSHLPSPFTDEDVLAGYGYSLSILQIEFALTQVFDRPLSGRKFFEEVIRENIDIGRPDKVSLIFNRRVTKRTPGKFSTRVLTQGVIPSLHVSYKLSKIKQYFKEGRALRTETTINNPRDFGIGKMLTNLPALREVGFTANRRLLSVQKVSSDCMIGEERFERLMGPVEVDGQRGSALKLGDPRAMALLSALCLFSLQPRGFKNADLRFRVAELLGVAPESYSRGKMTYDLRRLKLHGLIKKVPRTFQWNVTKEGVRVSLFVTKVHSRLLRPGLSEATGVVDVACGRKAAKAIRNIDKAVNTLFEEAKLAA